MDLLFLLSLFCYGRPLFMSLFRYVARINSSMSLLRRDSLTGCTCRLTYTNNAIIEHCVCFLDITKTIMTYCCKPMKDKQFHKIR